MLLSTFSDGSGLATDNDIIVYGRAIEQIGVASSASEGTVGYKDFEQRPLSRRDLVYRTL